MTVLNFSKNTFKDSKEKDKKIVDFMGENFVKLIDKKIANGFKYYSIFYKIKICRISESEQRLQRLSGMEKEL